MTYTFRGQFCGSLAPEFSEPLAGVTVRLYKYRGGKYISSLAVAEPGETIEVLTADAISAKAASLLGEATADAAGHFILTLDEAEYKGEAFDLDLVLSDAPGRKSRSAHVPLQVTLTTMKPRWEAAAGDHEGDHVAHWEYCLPPNPWHAIRARFDAWVIGGHVVAQATGQPLSGVRVAAFDADWLQDDALGSALTDAAGKFRIDYERADFTRTLLSPLVNMEEEGPDLYFKVSTPAGAPLLHEPKDQGYTPGRKNAGHCTFVALLVADAPEPA
jgi:hypothetical protein